MIISCPKCSSQFNVPDSAITAEGRKVKCSDCSESWIQKLDGIEEIATITNKSSEQSAEAEKKANEANDSELAEKAARRAAIRASSTGVVLSEYPYLPLYERWYVKYPSMIAAFASILFFAVVALIANRQAVTNVMPSSQYVYDMVDLHQWKDIKFEMIDCTVSEIKSSKNEDNSVELEVKVVMRNTSDQPQLLDAVRFTVFSKDKEHLGDYTVHYQKTIPAEGEETIEGRLNRVPRDTMFVVVEMGNRLEIMLRDPYDVAKS